MTDEQVWNGAFNAAVVACYAYAVGEKGGKGFEEAKRSARCLDQFKNASDTDLMLAGAAFIADKMLVLHRKRFPAKEDSR